MPRKPIDHSKSLVYKFSKDGNDLYVGSTTSFTKRKSTHKRNCNNPKNKEYNKPFYVYIRANGGWDSGFVMVLVQLYPECKSTIELRMYERQHYDILIPQLNAKRPCLYEGEKKELKKDIDKQYYNENKVQIAKKKKEYRADNTERINQKHTCLCGGQYSTKNRSEHNKTQKHIKYCQLIQAQAPTTINL